MTVSSTLPNPEKDLGKLVSTHTTSPVFLQRAAIVAVVSFLFFLAMLIVFYIRQNVGYFALSTAFLIVYIFTLVGWVVQKRNAVSIYENGIKYRKFRTTWNEIKAVKADKSGLEITKNRHEKAIIPSTMLGFESIIQAVKDAVETRAA
ncbi:MAG: hypothetical protein HOP17_00795 [Acidobacteria bacterium]|nr:hypothetical protein [Acidobacteriota bacterium]